MERSISLPGITTYETQPQSIESFDPSLASGQPLAHCGETARFAVCQHHEFERCAKLNNSLDRLSEAYFCFHPSCEQLVYCEACLREHKAHAGYFFNLEEALGKMEEFSHNLRVKGTSRIGRAVQILQKYSLLSKFKQEMDQKWESIEGELLGFLTSTEGLVQHLTTAKRQLESEMAELDDGKGSLSQLYSRFQVDGNGRFDSMGSELERVDEDWKTSIVALVDHEVEFKEYAMKAIEVITDNDYDVFDRNTKGEASKFSKLHQEVKQQLIRKKQQKQALLWSESTKVSSYGSEVGSSLKSDASMKGAEKAGRQHAKEQGNKDRRQQGRIQGEKEGKKERRKAETQVWLSRILDLYQVREL